MLAITVGGKEMFDEDREAFIYYPKYDLELEHSLVSISKWEFEYRKPFITDKDHTKEEWLFYIKCMDLKGNITDEVLAAITNKDILKIAEYVDNPHTATTISNHDPNSNSPSNEIITSEVVYYMMTAAQIPFECENWNFSRLMTLIRVCSIKNNPRKMSKNDQRSYYSDLKRKTRSRKPRK